MTEYDYWEIFPREWRRQVTIGDITVRDGFQHLEKFFNPAPRYSTPKS